MINKTKKPEIRSGEKPLFPTPVERYLSNGIPIYSLNVGNQDLVRVDFIFNAGSVFAENPFLAETVNALIDSGTDALSSAKIAEEFDFYGAYLEKYSGHHKSKIVLYTLNKYFEQTLKIISEIIYHTVFPEKEIELFIQNKYQNYLINRRKTEIISSEIFMQCLYGKNHPYGKAITDKDFKDINSYMIKDFYKKYYIESGIKIIISGKITDHHYDLFEKYFGRVLIQVKTVEKNVFQIDTSSQMKNFEHMNDMVQSSVKIGKITINKKHPDFFDLNITTILLGGYFGSRLMKNIREDKGYTYGIYASNSSLLESGFFSISAETGKQVFEKAIEEIYNELRLLRIKTIQDDELVRVKSWIFGTMLKAFDGPFALSETLASIIDYEMDFNYYENYFERIKSITTNGIRETAEKYLNEQNMFEVVAGCK